MPRRSSFSPTSYVEHRSFFIRDYILEDDDGTMRQAMNHIADEEDTIHMHNEALQAIEDAALARALALSEESAIREARRRVRLSGAHIPSTSLRQNLPEPTNALAIFPSKAHATGSSAEGRANPESNQAAARANMEPISIDATNEKRAVPSSSRVSNATSSEDAHILSALTAARPDSCSREKSPRRASSQWPAEQSGLSSQNNVIDDPTILAQNGFPATNDGSDFSQELFSNVRFFAPPRKCCHCDEHIERVHSSETVVGLHAICPVCKRRYCRGCFGLAGCPPGCAGGENCTVEDCCPGIRAIAAFDALSDFSNAFAAALRTHQDPGRHYVKTFMRQKDPSIRRFEHTFVNTLRTLPPVLRSLSAEIHPPIAHLVATSCLPRVMHDYLKHQDVYDWMLHSDTYQAILDAVKELPACGLGAIFSEPFACDKGVVPAGTNKVTEDVRRSCLKDAVMHLDGHYKQFMALSARITFPATLLKMHRLSDGILYLLLQQVVN